MNYFKIRQKTTGLYFSGNKKQARFEGSGKRYFSSVKANDALKFLEEHRQHVNRCWIDGAYKTKVLASLQPDNFEIVEIQEIEINVIPNTR